ncbi:MAG TPA: DMT family transporter, partial [Actinomycetota bacterium]
VGWGTADFLGGLSTKRLSIWVVSVVSQIAGLVFMAAVVVGLGRGPVEMKVVWLGMAAGVCGLIGLSALYTALALGPMGVVAPISALSVVVSVGAGLVRGDRPTSVQLVGIAAAIVGVLLASRAPEGHGEPVTTRAVVLSSIAAVAFGALLVFLDQGARIDPEWTTVSVRIGAVALLVPIVVIARPSFSTSRHQFGTLVMVGLLDNGANLSFAIAASTGQLLSVIAVLAALYPVATVLLARGVLHERLARSQTVGVIAAFTGIALIALG